jgi:predicted nucleotidyltransferase
MGERMIQKEFKDMIFEFVKECSDFEILQSIFLFGSVAKGEADKRSDVDLLVVFDTNKNVEKINEKSNISKIALDMEKKFDKNMQLVFTNKKFDKLDRQFVEQILKEGIILFGKNPQVDVKKLKMQPYSLIYYSLKGLSRSDKMRVKKALYGHATIKKYKGKIYKSEVRGLIEEFEGKRTGIASFLVPAKKFRIFSHALKRFGVEYRKIDVWIPEV